MSEGEVWAYLIIGALGLFLFIFPYVMLASIAGSLKRLEQTIPELLSSMQSTVEGARASLRESDASLRKIASHHERAS